VPPTGIPAPSFGIDQQAPDHPSGPSDIERPGLYIVDNTHAGASDSARYGTPSKPRRSIPSQVPPGSVVQVRGGPYQLQTDLVVGGLGTARAPIFYRGDKATRIAADGATQFVVIRGSYVVMEGFEFVNAPPRLDGDHLVIRNNEVRGHLPRRGGAGVYAGASSDAVVFRNHIHNNGDPSLPRENDIHGVHVAAGAARIWILENHIHHNGGDSVQVNSGPRGTMARYIYIGRNRMHDEGENAVDIKTAEDVFVSQNDMHGFRPVIREPAGSDGAAIVVNNDNLANGRDNRIWILFNRIHDSYRGIRTQAYAKILGNVLHDIQDDAIVSFGSHDVLVEHNTFDRVGTAVTRAGGGPGFKIVVANNLINSRGKSDLEITGNAAKLSTISHIVFPEPAVIRWRGRMYRGLSSLRVACEGCREGAARLGDPAAHRLDLVRGSPAIDAGDPSAVYSQFQKLYGRSIAVDFEGHARPAGRQWDVGAYEFVQ
jgi:hypothetical protein